jgi:UDP-N-acetylglucosamine acyltransferase
MGSNAPNIHPTALVSSDAEIGNEVVVGPFAIVEAQTVIGDGCVLAARSHVKTWTRLGTGNRVSEGAVLGGEPQHLGYQGEETWLEIGDGNFIGEYVTIHRGTAETGKTVLGSNCYLMGYTHVGHDCRIGNKVILTNYTGVAGHCRIDDAAIFGAYAGTHQFVRVGTMAMVGAGAKLGKDLVPYTIAQGYPARPKAINLVGLERNQVEEGSRNRLRKAFKILFRSGRTLPEALTELEALSDDPHVRHLVEFVRESKRGICL